MHKVDGFVLIRLVPEPVVHMPGLSVALPDAFVASWWFSRFIYPTGAMPRPFQASYLEVPDGALCA
jgi:hypothetical protein